VACFVVFTELLESCLDLFVRLFGGRVGSVDFVVFCFFCGSSLLSFVRVLSVGWVLWLPVCRECPRVPLAELALLVSLLRFSCFLAFFRFARVVLCLGWVVLGSVGFSAVVVLRCFFPLTLVFLACSFLACGGPFQRCVFLSLFGGFWISRCLLLWVLPRLTPFFVIFAYGVLYAFAGMMSPFVCRLGLLAGFLGFVFWFAAGHLCFGAGVFCFVPVCARSSVWVLRFAFSCVMCSWDFVLSGSSFALLFWVLHVWFVSRLLRSFARFGRLFLSFSGLASFWFLASLVAGAFGFGVRHAC